MFVLYVERSFRNNKILFSLKCYQFTYNQTNISFFKRLKAPEICKMTIFSIICGLLILFYVKGLIYFSLGVVDENDICVIMFEVTITIVSHMGKPGQ